MYGTDVNDITSKKYCMVLKIRLAARLRCSKTGFLTENSVV
jgi:hypothetical protein